MTTKPLRLTARERQRASSYLEQEAHVHHTLALTAETSTETAVRAHAKRHRDTERALLLVATILTNLNED